MYVWGTRQSYIWKDKQVDWPMYVQKNFVSKVRTISIRSVCQRKKALKLDITYILPTLHMYVLHTCYIHIAYVLHTCNIQIAYIYPSCFDDQNNNCFICYMFHMLIYVPRYVQTCKRLNLVINGSLKADHYWIYFVIRNVKTPHFRIARVNKSWSACVMPTLWTNHCLVEFSKGRQTEWLCG
jgi:hypothetical protein